MTPETTSRTSESLGARLRRRREEQGIDLVAIAERTKIGVPLLHGLERDDVSQWPSGIFRRAFVRSYALAIGADADAVVREFLDVHPEPAEFDPAALAKALDGAPKPGRNGGGFRGFVGSFVRLRRPAAVVAEDRPAKATAPVPTHRSEVAPIVPTPLRGTGAQAGPLPPSTELRPARIPREADAPATVTEPPPSDPDLTAVAHLCTRFTQVQNAAEILPLLREAGGLLHAKGLIVWVWDTAAASLRPALAHGYSRSVLARFGVVSRDDDNATAAAFRSGEPCLVSGDGSACALAVPLLGPAGCTGVLAIELPRGAAELRATRAVATIIGALLAQLIGDAR